MLIKDIFRVLYVGRRYPSSLTTDSVSPLNKLKTVSLSLPNYPTSFVNLRYYDSSLLMPKIDELRSPTVMISHGIPGSHTDFKYMIPFLESFGYRVLIPNWPGFGISDNPPKELFSQTNVERAQLLLNFVNALNLRKIDVTLGFSAGCYPLPLFLNRNPQLCKSAVLLCSLGTSPLKEASLANFLERNQETPLKPVVSVIAYVIACFMFRYTPPHIYEAVNWVRLIDNVDFSDLNSAILNLKSAKNPSVILLSGKNDRIVEGKKFFEYAEKLGCSDKDTIHRIKKGSELEEIFARILKSGKLDRHYAVLFEHGTHGMPKREAESICKLINSIITSNQS